MRIRRATENELLDLWGYGSIHTASSNAKFFYNNIKRGNPVMPCVKLVAVRWAQSFLKFSTTMLFSPHRHFAAVQAAYSLGPCMATQSTISSLVAQEPSRLRELMLKPLS